MIVTTRSFKYALTSGGASNTVEATITATPGFHWDYLGNVPGWLKVGQLVLAALALALVASHMVKVQPVPVAAEGHAHGHNATEQAERLIGRGDFLVGDLSFICAHSVVLAMVSLLTYLYTTEVVSSIIISRTTSLEIVMNGGLAGLLVAVGLLQIAMTETWTTGPMAGREEVVRVTAGLLACINGALCGGSCVLAHWNFYGRPEPLTLTGGTRQKED